MTAPREVSGSWYTDPAHFARERATLFTRSWTLMASEEELTSPGDYVTATIGDAPVVVVRDGSGSLAAFHNLCRHRGITLLEGAGRVGRFITCPYHQWSYTASGELARIPQGDEQFPGLDLTDWGLRPAQVGVMGGLVFVNPDPAAPDLPTAAAGLDVRLGRFFAEPLVEIARVVYEAPCNWKLLVENHVDVYHLWYLHQHSLRMYEHRSFRWEGLGANWFSCEPLREPNGVAGGFASITEEERTSIGAHLLFPNTMIVTTGEYLATYDAAPLAPDRTRLTLRVRAEHGADAEMLVDSIRSFLAEDIDACRRMQEAAHSPRFGLGPLARDHEEPVRRFHAALLREIGAPA